MRAVIGFGSNCGNRLRYLRQAVRELRSAFGIVEMSPIYESDAMMPEGAPAAWDIPFLNLAVSLDTALEPRALLAKLKAIEAGMGRSARERWAPREIDLDILDMEGVRMNAEDLAIPHRDLERRPFALLPFADLAAGSLSEQSRARVAAWRFAAPEDVPFRTRRTGLVLTELFGILNLTPDSFSDGGLYTSTAEALARARQLHAQGASVIDLGAESTRPGATPVTPAEEWRRLAPVLEVFPAELSLSIDTRHAESAMRVASRVAYINDVSGGGNPELVRAVADSKASLIFMHNLGVPPRSDRRMAGEDPVAAILAWGERRIAELVEQGVPRERLVFDPGLGFGKSAAQNWEIIRRAPEFSALGVRTLIGHSRKSFLSENVDRDGETSVISARLVDVDYLRVHDVDSNARALRAAAWLR